jgi:hypothetical protein
LIRGLLLNSLPGSSLGMRVSRALPGYRVGAPLRLLAVTNPPASPFGKGGRKRAHGRAPLQRLCARVRAAGFSPAIRFSGAIYEFSERRFQEEPSVPPGCKRIFLLTIFSLQPFFLNKSSTAPVLIAFIFHSCDVDTVLICAQLQLGFRVAPVVPALPIDYLDGSLGSEQGLPV